MKLKTIAFIAVLTAISLTSCKNSPATENSVAESSITEQSVMPETTKPEERSTVSETSIQERSEDDFFHADTGQTTTSSQIVEDESSLVMEVAEYEYAENELRGGIKITKYNGTNTEVVIPNSIDGSEVTSIGDYAFKENEKIVSVTIPNTILDIEIEAFANCKNLLNVIFEDNSKLERIFTGAFQETGITEFTVPENCKRVGDAFYRSNINKLVILGKETQFAKDFAFSSLDVVVYFSKGSEAEKYVTLHTPYTYKYLDELE